LGYWTLETERSFFGPLPNLKLLCAAVGYCAHNVPLVECCEIRVFFEGFFFAIEEKA